MSRCKHLRYLPLGIIKLCNLRHLDLIGTKLPGMPIGMGKLLDLRLLRGFAVGGGNRGTSDQFHPQGGWCNLEEVKSLSKLTTFNIYYLESLSSTADARASALKTMIHLKELKLCFARRSYGEVSIQINEEVLEELCPPTCLEMLCIEGYIGLDYPSWMMRPALSIPNLKKLLLTNCREVRFPPVWVLPQLEFLCISGAYGITSIGPELVGFVGRVAADEGEGGRARTSFPKLRELRFVDMPYWREWWWFTEEVEAVQTMGWRLLPCLEKLTIKDCPVLSSLSAEGLLRHATALKELWIEGTHSLTKVMNFRTVTKLTLESTRNIKYLVNFPALKHFDCYNNHFNDAYIRPRRVNKDLRGAYVLIY